MTLQKIEEIDENLKVPSALEEQDLHFLDVRREPFRVYGLYNYREELPFKRMPDSVAASVSEKVKCLNACTTGGRVRFSTDSKYIAIKAVMPSVTTFPHMTLLGTAGFDLFIDDERSAFRKAFMPPAVIKDGYESILYFPDCRTRNITINFPIYSSVESLYIGLQNSAGIGGGKEYHFKKPVLYYGSSITQGGCTSRPGNSYPAILSRQLDCDFINFGFSGSAKGEPAIAEYISSMEIGALVCDYDHNAPNADYLAATHEPFYKKIREKAPILPIVLISKPDFDISSREDIMRRECIYRTFIHAVQNGDENIFFIDGQSFFNDGSKDCYTVDGCHPNDAGFLKMAERIGCTVGEILRKNESRE